MKRIEAVNDFVVKFANVNGSGSASANELFARSILRMGVPVSPRNIFPSNIQGLPTWYEVRVNERGWQARRGGVPALLVGVGPGIDEDAPELEAFGFGHDGFLLARWRWAVGWGRAPSAGAGGVSL